MQIALTINNYRCFHAANPARIIIKPGFTALVGVNNSGKSSLLKFFYEFRRLFSLMGNPTGNFLNAVGGYSETLVFNESVTDPDEVFCNLNELDLRITIEVEDEGPLSYSPVPYAKRLDIFVQRSSRQLKAVVHIGSGPLPAIGYDFRGNVLVRTQNGEGIADLSFIFAACNDLEKTFYIGPFRNALNIGAKENYYDIQIGQAFINQWRNYQSGPSKRHNQFVYKLTQDIKQIFGFDDLQIHPASNNQSLNLLINGKSYGLSEVGSGIAQFIIVLANAAIHAPTYILIDEPELNLHPSLQLDFLTTLASYAKHGIIFSTHSIGLARIGAQRSYSFKKLGEQGSELKPYEATARLSEFLGELSFEGYRELGFNTVLLVEGPKDILTVQQFLRQLRKDHKVVLIHLGGGSGINPHAGLQLEEIKRITTTVYALIDSEKDKLDAPLDRGRRGFEEACEAAKIKCCVLERRAIENYLTDRAVKVVKGEKYRALLPYELLGAMSPSWGKEENWKIAREMRMEEWIDTDLGKFLTSF
ncbi:MAG: AAA family ATPase [Nitrospira sp.]|nr:AAA family ATPase [Nitrospira sp.]